ncbi:MAG: membrane dipeptidase, partial [Gelidibacter sp.]|nr:membrane dipeptidase [Gelidibacter sp.]
MKTKIIIISILFVQQLVAQSYQKIHDKAILVDTHNDFLSKTTDYGFVFDTDLSGKTHSDLARLNKGGVDVQLFSVFCDGDK